MKKLLNEILSSIEERFDYKKIETTREHKQTLYLDTEYIDTSSTKRYVIVTANQIHSFFEIGLYHIHDEQIAEKYLKEKQEDNSVDIKKDLTPIISIWYYFKEQENGKHETVIFDTLISPNERMNLNVDELTTLIENAFIENEAKQEQLSALRGN